MVLLLVAASTVCRPVPAVAVTAALRNVAPDRTVTWLDIGDSYASGEGATAATGYCQQSANAFGPRAAAVLSEQRQWRIDRSPMTACTSHRAVDLFNSPAELRGTPAGTPPDRPAGVVPDNNTSLWQWGKATSGGRSTFDIVTMSFGGNDIHFADTLLHCLGFPDVTLTWDAFFAGHAVTDGSCARNESDLRRVVESFTTQSSALQPLGDAVSPGGGKAGSLADFYRTVASSMVAPDGVLVVAGYPRLFTPSSTWGRWRGGSCNGVSAAEADMLGRLSEQLDAGMRAAVATADGGRGRIRYVSRLELFDAGGNGKSLCGNGVEWLNTIFLPLRDGTLRKERAFHPNDLGNNATAERVAGEIDAKIGKPPPTTTTASTAPTPTTRPRVASGASTYDVGSDFDAHCTLAWPFAPSHGALSTQFRSTCQGVPKQFLFVDVVYGGELQLSPSHPQVHVRGQVNDIQKSEMGFTVLVVEATDVQVE